MSNFLKTNNNRVIDVLLETMTEAENLTSLADQVVEHSYLSGLPSYQITTGKLGNLLGELDQITMFSAFVPFEMRDLSEEMIFDTIEIFNECGDEFERLVIQLNESEYPVQELIETMNGSFPHVFIGYVVRFLKDLLQIRRLLVESNGSQSLPEKDFVRN